MYYNIQGSWQVSDAPGVIMFRPFLYDESTGFESSTETYTTLQIYPNPARDLVYFNIPEAHKATELQIEIIDASGRLIRQIVTSSNSLDISDLSQGIYYIRAISGSIIYHSKLLINP